MLRSRHGLQSALSYPFSVIPPSISLSLHLSLSLSLKMAVHSVMIPPTLSLSLFLSACHPTGFSCSDYCLFIEKQNPLWGGFTILTENEETEIYHFSSLLSVSLSHTHTPVLIQHQMVIRISLKIITGDRHETLTPFLSSLKITLLIFYLIFYILSTYHTV